MRVLGEPSPTWSVPAALRRKSGAGPTGEGQGAGGYAGLALTALPKASGVLSPLCGTCCRVPALGRWHLWA